MGRNHGAQKKDVLPQCTRHYMHHGNMHHGNSNKQHAQEPLKQVQARALLAKLEAPYTKDEGDAHTCTHWN